jgi:hypothetical protein
MTRARPSPQRLLTSHFLRQFLENDLISPDADRLQFLAVSSATILSVTIFVSTMMSLGYVMAPLMTPGLAAVLSLSDKFFYLALGMIATALVAASQWSALAIDSRDAVILEPLPIHARTIRRAKLAAVAILGMGAALAINLCPTIIFPPFLVYTLNGVTVIGLLGLVVTHAVVTTSASAFGYLAVVALREVMLAVLGVRWFARVSPWTQGALIVVLGGSLLLLPAAASGVAQRGFDDWRLYSPPMWFLGVYETVAGGVIADSPRGAMRPGLAANDRRSSALYATRRSTFAGLARQAVSAFALTFLIAAIAYLWNARRVSALATAPPPTLQRQRVWLRGIVNALLLRKPAVRAGFYFALAAMWRSNTHRLTLAGAAAVGGAMAVVAMSATNLQQGAVVSPRLLAMQPLLYGALLVGFRHGIRVPAELRANWGFQLAWRGEVQAFATGAKIGALIALVLPSLALVWPLYALVLGPQQALVHAALGLAGAVVMLEGLMWSYEKVPFTCTYLPSDNMKALGPIYVIGFVLGASIFARVQYDALQSGAASTFILLAVLFVIFKVASAVRRRMPQVQFDEAPATFQRLGLDT